MSMTFRGWLLALSVISLISVLATALTTATVYGAQEGPSGRWWRNARIVSQLKLTDGEIQRLERTFESSRLNMIKLKGKVEAEQFKLQNLVEKRDIDEKAIKNQHRKLETARSALAEEQLSFFVRVRKIIGYDRYRKLEALQKPRR